MYCRTCGTKLHDNAEMCVKCGCRPLTGNRYCQDCGTPTRENQELCVKCGEKLKLLNSNIESTQKIKKICLNTIRYLLIGLSIILFIFVIVHIGAGLFESSLVRAVGHWSRAGSCLGFGVVCFILGKRIKKKLTS